MYHLVWVLIIRSRLVNWEIRSIRKLSLVKSILNLINILKLPHIYSLLKKTIHKLILLPTNTTKNAVISFWFLPSLLIWVFAFLLSVKKLEEFWLSFRFLLLLVLVKLLFLLVKEYNLLQIRDVWRSAAASRFIGGYCRWSFYVLYLNNFMNSTPLTPLLLLILFSNFLLLFDSFLQRGHILIDVLSNGPATPVTLFSSWKVL